MQNQLQEICRNAFAYFEKRVELSHFYALARWFHLNILPSQKEPVKPVRHKHGLSTELPLQVPPFLQGFELQSRFAPSNKMTQLKLTQKYYVIKLSPFNDSKVHLK